MDDASLADWLRLREAADWDARCENLTRLLVSSLPRDGVVRIVDLGTGTGSNLRYLAERLSQGQEWLLVDRSAPLLKEGEVRTREWAAERRYRADSTAEGFVVHGSDFRCRIEARTQDLSSISDPSLFAHRHLVTASALLDLVSESWLQSLARGCRQAGASALFTINYDGRFSCTPVEAEDEWIRMLMNQHQLRDKGLGGPAEGAGASACAARCFRAEGYWVKSASSDWELGRDHEAMQRTLIDGWAAAAREIAPANVSAIASWRARRLAHVDAGRSRLVVGHEDLAAWRDR